MQTLLIVDDDELIQDTLGDFFSAKFNVVGAGCVDDVKHCLSQNHKPDYAFVDLGLPPEPHTAKGGLEAINILKSTVPECTVIAVSGQAMVQNAKLARAQGAMEYIEKPCEPQKLMRYLQQAKKSHDLLRQNFGLVGESKPIMELRDMIKSVATVPFSVLIEGESGTGKELVAHALHQYSQPSGKFVAINCAAIPAHLVEVSLFGHAKGAYSGAATAGKGYLADAAGGTLLLDEIADIPTDLQAKLLRVLETGEYYRVGETTPRHNTARILACSNKPIKQFVREDLYHRLGVIRLKTPPLREMGQDKFLLFKHYQTMVAQETGLGMFSLTTDAKNLFANYSFPGNVRELKNLAARLQVKYSGQAVCAQELQSELCYPLQNITPITITEDEATRQKLQAIGRQQVLSTLKNCEGDLPQAAQLLNITTEDLQTMVKVN